MMFDQYVGIDYSGASKSEQRLSNLAVYAAGPKDRVPQRVEPAEPAVRRWSRCAIASWLKDQIAGQACLIIGIDHGFSFPDVYFQRRGLRNWDHFLRDFVKIWPMHQPGATIKALRAEGGALREYQSYGNALRLTECWTGTAKSVFQFGMQGSVAHSTHAGLPWLWELRQRYRKRLHFWPFDGWSVPDGKSVIAEVYPALFSRRFDRESRSPDEQDAYAVARWLLEMDRRGCLSGYFSPPLSPEERRQAAREGWILGVF